MAKIKSLDELKKIKEQAKNSVSLRVKGDNIENMIQIRVAMATCGIASGAREVMTEFIEELQKQNMDNEQHVKVFIIETRMRSRVFPVIVLIYAFVAIDKNRLLCAALKHEVKVLVNFFALFKANIRKKLPAEQFAMAGCHSSVKPQRQLQRFGSGEHRNIFHILNAAVQDFLV